jgi:phosphoribosyl-AMP cyclohydrolase
MNSVYGAVFKVETSEGKREDMKKIEELKWGSSGLIPAVVQDAETGEVLTVAYVSRESLAKTRELGETVFYSRSRQCLWHKGETSGNTQKVISVATDCDEDAIVIRVHPKGPACHTGARSCFFEEVEGFGIQP